MSVQLPPFGKFLDKLHEAGVETGTARGFWGGVDRDGGLVVTSWIDANDGNGRFYLWRPKTNHGGLKAAWELGNVRPGVQVKLILLRQRGNLPLGVEGRSVAEAALFTNKWRIVQMVEGQGWKALLEPQEEPRLEIAGYSPVDDGGKIYEVTLRVVDGYRTQTFDVTFPTPLARSDVGAAALQAFRTIAEHVAHMVPVLDRHILHDSPEELLIEGTNHVLKFGVAKQDIVRDEFLLFAASAHRIATHQSQLDFHYPKRGAAA
ncbi:hypothetical protein [Bradyrhizobium sp.]|uniref:hypothetical protein n=1 Tax=Bradyrhizobium sp. TaxID=376 RepID=UPI0039E5E0E2